MQAPERQTGAEIAALKIILTNVVAHLALVQAPDPKQVRMTLDLMKDECKRAASLSTVGPAAGADRDRVVSLMQNEIEAFFKGITIA